MSSALLRDAEAAAFRPWEPERLDGSTRGAKGRSALPTVGDLERIHQAAQKEGFDTGYAQAKARVEAETARFTALFTTARREIEAAETAAAEQIVALAVEIARHVVRRAVELDREHIMGVVRDAVGQLPLFAQSGRILLNPEDAALVREGAGAELERLGWQIGEDLRLPRGDCHLDTGTAHLDATLETRLARVIAALGREVPRTIDQPAREPDIA